MTAATPPRRPGRLFYILTAALVLTMALPALFLRNPEISAERLRELCGNGKVTSVSIQGQEFRAYLPQGVDVDGKWTSSVRGTIPKALSEKPGAIEFLTEGVPVEAVDIVPERDMSKPIMWWSGLILVIILVLGTAWVWSRIQRGRVLAKLSDQPGDQVARLLVMNQREEAIKQGRDFLERDPLDTTVRINLTVALLLVGNVKEAGETHAAMDVSKLEGEQLKLYEAQRKELETRSKA